MNLNMLLVIVLVCCLSPNVFSAKHRGVFGSCRSFTPNQTYNRNTVDISNTTWRLTNTSDIFKGWTNPRDCSLYKFSTPINGTINLTCNSYNSPNLQFLNCDSGKLYVLAADNTYLVTYQCRQVWFVHTENVNVFRNATAPANSTSSIPSNISNILASNNLSRLYPRYTPCRSQKKQAHKKDLSRKKY